MKYSYFSKLNKWLALGGGRGGSAEIIRDAHFSYLPGDILRFLLRAKYDLQDTILDIF